MFSYVGAFVEPVFAIIAVGFCDCFGACSRMTAPGRPLRTRRPASIGSNETENSR